MDDVDLAQRHLSAALIFGDGDVVRFREMAVERRQLLVPRMMERVHERAARNEAAARECRRRMGVDDIVRTAQADLLHRPRHVVQIGERIRRPLGLVIEASERRGRSRVSCCEELDIVTQPYEAFCQLINDKLGTTVQSGRYREEWSGDEGDAHVAFNRVSG